MINKYLLTFFAAGLLTATAADNQFKVTLTQDSVVDGKQLKAGSYKVQMENNVAVLKHGKDVVQVPANEVTVPNKFATNETVYLNNDDLTELHIGGTHTKIVFSNAGAAHTAG